MLDLKSWGPMTVIVVALIVIFAIGAIVCTAIGGDAYRHFLALASLAWKYAVAAGIVGVGRGIRLQPHPVTRKRATR